jgi:hypothetical protein
MEAFKADGRRIFFFGALGGLSLEEIEAALQRKSGVSERRPAAATPPGARGGSEPA